MNLKRRSVRTSDGVALSYLTGGSGQPLIMLCGWSQAATIFQHQFDALSAAARVFVVDSRGHGEPEKPESGYRIGRLAKDLFDLIVALDLDRPDIMAHSLSASVTWSYLLMFGTDRPPRRLIFVDEPSALLARPHWSEAERDEAGAIIPSLEALGDFCTNVRACDTPERQADLLRGMFTAAVSEDDLLAIARENLKLPRRHAATLLEDNCIQSWQSLIPTIMQPTLVFAGEASVHPVASQRWIAESVHDGQLAAIPASEGGSHFMFFEDPERFNERVVQFLTT